jgi:hypothetical protein
MPDHTFQVGSRQVGSPDVGVRQVDCRQVVCGQVGTGEVGVGRVGAQQDRVLKGIPSWAARKGRRLSGWRSSTWRPSDRRLAEFVCQVGARTVGVCQSNSIQIQTCQVRICQIASRQLQTVARADAVERWPAMSRRLEGDRQLRRGCGRRSRRIGEDSSVLIAVRRRVLDF